MILLPILLSFIFVSYINADEVKNNVITANHVSLSYERYLSGNKFSAGAGVQSASLGKQYSDSFTFYDPVQRVILPENQIEYRKSHPNWYFSVKYFPFSGGFYVSGLAGIAKGEDINVSETGLGVDPVNPASGNGIIKQTFRYNIKTSSTPFVGASIGYRFEFDSGFILGFELGTGKRMEPKYTFQVEPNVGLLNTSRAQSPFLNYAYREYLMEKNPPFKTAADVDIANVYLGYRF